MELHFVLHHISHHADLSADRVDVSECFFGQPAFNPHNVRLWVIGHEFGAVCAVWASCEQDALDNAADRGWMDMFLIGDDADVTDDAAFLGNAGEPFDLTYAWCVPVQFDPVRDLRTIVILASAHGAEYGPLSD